MIINMSQYLKLGLDLCKFWFIWKCDRRLKSLDFLEQMYIVLFNMFRVLLKIDKVNIRIKEAVHIHIIVKKKQEYFTHCKH